MNSGKKLVILKAEMISLLKKIESDSRYKEEMSLLEINTPVTVIQICMESEVKILKHLLKLLDVLTNEF